MIEKKDLALFSLLMRLAIGSLFLCAAIVKVPNGIAGTVGYYESLFQNSILPLSLVRIHASVIMFVEFVLAALLLSGYRLRAAWFVAGLTLISLAVGMLFAGKYDVASDNFVYVFLSAVGLILSSFDTLGLGGQSKTKK